MTIQCICIDYFQSCIEWTKCIRSIGKCEKMFSPPNSVDYNTKVDRRRCFFKNSEPVNVVQCMNSPKASDTLCNILVF